MCVPELYSLPLEGDAISCYLFMYSPTSLVRLQTGAHSSSLTAGKCSCARSWISPTLNVTLFVATLFFTVPQNCSMEFKSGWYGNSLITVCTCLASKSSIAWSHMAACELYEDHTALSLSCHSSIQPEQHFSFPFWQHSHSRDQHIPMCSTPATNRHTSLLPAADWSVYPLCLLSENMDSSILPRDENCLLCMCH
jgi:hypothetical protein